MIVVNRIKELLNERGISRYEFSKRLGHKSSHYVYLLTDNKVMLRVDKAFEIAQILDCDIKDLFEVINNNKK